ncbi:unnamed protein product [Adineta steineri]|uniref:Uncharacterized protein n=1 Tax=Adineta steineri TaxID=433720 RepID=A0A815R3V9_9BILA|nr:unnamed protein product [Adineta steineri]CAF4070915.1 unnamed protein product [Adineta steineri]
MAQTMFIICIGDNIARKRIVEHITQNTSVKSDLRWATLIHPFSCVSRSASISEGTIVCAGAVIGPHTFVGSHTIINTHASVDHDCRIGNYVHIAPGVRLCGAVHVEDLTVIGVGTQVIPEILIGQEVIIEAGSTILKNVDDRVKADSIVKRSKIEQINSVDQCILWLAQKPVNYSRIEFLLSQSALQNHFANFGPCVQLLEIALKNILEIDSSKAVILTSNGSAALHAIVGGLEIFRESKLKFATQAFTFATSVQCSLIGSIIVDIDESIGLDFNLIDTDLVDGIIVTNVFGHVVDINKYTQWADKHDKYLIFDNAATSFTFYQGKIWYCSNLTKVNKPMLVLAYEPI